MCSPTWARTLGQLHKKLTEHPQHQKYFCFTTYRYVRRLLMYILGHTVFFIDNNLADENSLVL